MAHDKSWYQRGLGPQDSGLKIAGLQDRKFGALGLHCSTPRLDLAKNSIFVWAPNRGRLWAPGSTTKIPGLQGSKDSSPPPPPFGTLTSDSKATTIFYLQFGIVLKQEATFVSASGVTGFIIQLHSVEYK